MVSSRKIQRATYEDVAFRYLSADTHPDFGANEKLTAHAREKLTIR